ncbi:FXSXX-COOH protein [Nocardiopsis sp. CNR-923]|uniref:FXSXX-COOH protein n=1 Tax=Nocardiopsis sp. CNR-923 TaxID=1904965 RepID=UPI0009635D33|nr:FXSXX-COOH protein [Nocardiopsis sp. CNR-923]OLT25127.1 FXSXX-COOH protein [Nocardiopsis sp. CNR-923]
MPRQHLSGGVTLVDADGLTLRDLDGYGETAVIWALRSVLEPGAGVSEAIASFTSDGDEYA